MPGVGSHGAGLRYRADTCDFLPGQVARRSVLLGTIDPGANATVISPQKTRLQEAGEVSGLPLYEKCSVHALRTEAPWRGELEVRRRAQPERTAGFPFLLGTHDPEACSNGTGTNRTRDH